MPMRWTPEKDQLLLLKILETHNLSVDTKKVVEAWPSHEEKPTARAITERLVKIRAIAKSNASASGNSTPGEKGGYFSNGKGVGSGRSSIAPTPRSGARGHPKGLSTAALTPSSSGKRKRAPKKVYSDTETESEEEEEEAEAATAVKIKTEMEVDEDADGEYELEGVYTPPMAKPEEDKKVARVLFPHAMTASSAPSSGFGGGDGAGTTATGLGVQPAVRSGSTLEAVVTPVKHEPRAARARSSAMRYGMVEFGDTLDDENHAGDRSEDVDSSASDYAPDQTFEQDDEFA
ncbi:hypothetical protein BJX64DRAFT_289686 [Aspergillus heterothallicus]